MSASPSQPRSSGAPRWPLVLALVYLGVATAAVAWLIVRWQGRFP